ncbi:FMRFamide receptor [Mizuhopecten yessoensis]|uniref:FMRFamide receptor n=1 Tax=Mizuhopecten yessoensis TaxID=6573 RepID=A0A210PJ22_MIZYE|nr:FMRFamide receptor [Mizuhopecten yessoensis]
MGDRNLSLQNQTSHIINGSIPVNNFTDFEDDRIVGNKENFYELIMPIISSLGIVGNIVSFVVLFQLSKSSSFYLYLAFLALSDMASLVFGGIFQWMRIVGFFQLSRSGSQFFCSVDFSCTLIFMQLYSWITVAVTIDRSIAVCHPFHVNQYCTRKRALIYIGVTFLIIAALNLPIICLKWDDENSSCVMPEFANVYCFKYSTYIEMFVYILIPVLLICIFNSLIARGLIISANKRRSLTSGNENNSCSTPIKNDSTKKTITTLFAVTAFYISAILPLLVYFIQEMVNGVENTFLNLIHLPIVAETCTLLNHSMNLLLYGFTGQGFREKFASMLCFQRFIRK